VIFLYTNTANTVVLTLDEKSSTSSYDTLWEFVSETTGEVKLFTAIDISTYARYNEFVITEGVPQNLLYGTVSLEPGQYKYTIYEMPVSSPKSLTKSANVGTLEEGRVTVFESETRTDYNDSEDKDTVTFE
jgi:hypothetical protein